jgi:hypothetical protein
MTHAINLLISLIYTLAGLVMAVIGMIDGFLGGLMTSAAIPPAVQTIILVAVALVLVIFALRALGGVFGVLIVLLLVLLVVHRLVPGFEVHGFEVPNSTLPAGIPSHAIQPPATPHT